MNFAARLKIKRLMATKALAALAKHQWFCFLAAALVGAADYLTGPDLSSGVFYLIPIALIAWWHSFRSVSIIALLCAAGWLFIDLASAPHYVQSMAPYWNGLTRLLIFLGLGGAVYRIRHLQLRQMDLLNYLVHDMRNPLMAFTTNLESIKADISKDMSPAVWEGIERCLIASKRMKTLINSTLDLARMEDGEMPLAIGTHSVGELVDRAILETSEHAGSKNIQVLPTVAAPSDLVQADATITHRVLVNLLANAINVSPKGSRVILNVDKAVNTHEIVFAVKDQGPGIPKEYISRVFDKFVQVQLSKTGKSSGSGLGLAFCKLAVCAQKGRIWIENLPDKGACVHVALPAAEFSQEPE
jgi:signal transduction histidine kinase